MLRISKIIGNCIKKLTEIAGWANWVVGWANWVMIGLIGSLDGANWVVCVWGGGDR